MTRRTLLVVALLVLVALAASAVRPAAAASGLSLRTRLGREEPDALTAEEESTEESLSEGSEGASEELVENEITGESGAAAEASEATSEEAAAAATESSEATTGQESSESTAEAESSALAAAAAEDAAEEAQDKKEEESAEQSGGGDESSSDDESSDDDDSEESNESGGTSEASTSEESSSEESSASTAEDLLGEGHMGGGESSKGESSSGVVPPFTDIKAGPEDREVDESLHRMQRMHKEQQRLNRIQMDMTARLQRIQAEFRRVAAAQHDVNRHAHELKLKEKLVGVEEATNRKRGADLRVAVQALSAEQSRLMHNQFAVQHLQQLLTMVGNPAFESLMPATNPGMVVNPNVVDGLLGEDAKMGAELAVGRYSLEGKTRNERTGQEVPVEVRMALHTDGTVTGSTEYAPHADAASHRVRIPLVGTWSPGRVTWVEEFNNRAFLFNGTYDAAKRSVSGAYEFPRDGDAQPARGTFTHRIHKYRIKAGNGGYLPPDFFKNEPGLETPHRKAPIRPGHLETGFYIVSGSTEDATTRRTHDMPDMLFNLQADGVLSGKTAYLAAKHAHMGGHPLSPHTVVRMTGAWKADGSVSYAFLYGNRVFKFNGTLGVGSHGLQGQYVASHGVSSAADGAAIPAPAHGIFQFVMRRVVFETKDAMAPPRFRALYERADDLSLPPVEHAPAGQVFNYYSGAAPTLAEVTAHGKRVGAYASPVPFY